MGIVTVQDLYSRMERLIMFRSLEAVVSRRQRYLKCLFCHRLVVTLSKTKKS